MRFVIKSYVLCQTLGFALAAADTCVFIYSKGKGNSLGIFNVNSPSVIESPVKLVNGGCRAI